MQIQTSKFSQSKMLFLTPLRGLPAIIFVAFYTLGQMAEVQAQPIRTETVASGLQNPWGLAFLPDGRFLVTERPGRLRVVEADGKLGPPLAGLPKIAASGQGGLLDVLLDADFARNRQLYLCFSEPAVSGNANSTALARATLRADSARLENLEVIFSQKPKVVSSAHFGCRIVESRKPGLGGEADGKLFLTLGERFSRKDDAQKLDNHLGKIVRINKDGTVPLTILLLAQPGRCSKSGVTVTATRRAQSSRRMAFYGSMSTGLRAATRSTCPKPEPITAGR